jgi:uncharacterized protein
MTTTTAAEPSQRFVTLDIVRGIAVMGILAMNIVGFAMPDAAYMNPKAYGTEGEIDLIAWAFNFVLIDGKMRGLFSFVFGASMLLVIERATAKSESPARIHFRRMIWLLLFGFIHYYFIWQGDILTMYALIGLLAWLFRDMEPKRLIRIGLVFAGVQALIFIAMAVSFAYVSHAASLPNPDPEMVRQWAGMQSGLGVPPPAKIAEEMALHLGPWTGVVHHQLAEGTFQPVAMAIMFGCETLGYMLLGMAGLKTGFFTGAWSDARYRKVALIGFAIGIPAYAIGAWLVWSSGFAVPMLVAVTLAAATLFRPVMVVAIAALVILLTRRGGALVDRIAAAGRAAFTNYLGTSIVMTALFYGWGAGLYGSLSRAELWLVVLGMWVLMLVWSKPWLDRFNYGPFEWLWRSLARWRLQPLRRRRPATA